MSNEQRTAIYGAVVAVLTALGVFGVITADEVKEYSAAGLELLAAASSLMAAVKTWKQRGKSAVVTLKVDGTNAEIAEAFTQALKQLQGRI
jgi:hypothetical protein